MPRIAIPADRDPLMYVWGEMAPPLTSAAGAYSDAVYTKSSLSLREFEAARYTMAQVNECVLCQGWRTARDVPGRAASPDEVPEVFYEHLLGDLDWEGFTERERLAADFSRRYATDHLSMDEAYWGRLRAVYDDEELVDLALCVGSWLALGRFNQVFDIDGGCRVP